MNIPESIRTALAAADDDYLVGLSNKGTVNRAKKDLQGLTPTAEAAGEMVVVTMGDEARLAGMKLVNDHYLLLVLYIFYLDVTHPKEF